MVGSRLVHLIERHAEELARIDRELTVEMTSDFGKIPAEELQRTTAELYRNLGEWLLRKTEKDIEHHFVSIAPAPGRRGNQAAAVCVGRRHEPKPSLPVPGRGSICGQHFRTV